MEVGKLLPRLLAKRRKGAWAWGLEKEGESAWFVAALKLISYSLS